MKIVVMGCGRVGARLARLFEREGHEVSVVDLHTEAFARLGPQFRGSTVSGTGIDEDVLKSAGIEEADIFLAVTNQDNANLMAAQIAKLMFQVPRVIARVYEPDREETYHQMGMETLCPTTLVSNRIYEAVSSGVDAHTPRVEPDARTVEPVHLPPPAPALAGVTGSRAGEPEGDAPAAGHAAHSLRQRFFR